MPKFFTALLERLHLTSSKSDSSTHHIPKKERKAAKLADRDHERTTDGLLRIALKRHSSENSFTAKDPSVHYRRREDHEKWVGHEAGGVRLGGEKDWKAKESKRGGERARHRRMGISAWMLLSVSLGICAIPFFMKSQEGSNVGNMGETGYRVYLCLAFRTNALR